MPDIDIDNTEYLIDPEKIPEGSQVKDYYDEPEGETDVTYPNRELMAIQSELKAPKNQYNAFGKYKYRSCEDILEALKPLLLKYKATLHLSDSIQMVGNRYYVKAYATFNSKSGIETVTAYAREPETKKGMDDSQITGTASSYARKYALNGLFCIDDTKDADFYDNTSSGKSSGKSTAKKQSAEKPKAEKKITETQVKHLWTTASECNFSNEDVHIGIKKYYGKTSVTALTESEYKDLIGKFKAAKK